MSLKSIIENDIRTVFLADALGFADDITIGTNSTDTKHVIASLQDNRVNNTSGNGAALQSFLRVCYIATADIAEYSLRDGQTIYINGAAYSILSLQDEMGVTTMNLRKGR